jgi:hypothetical protein
MELCLQPMKYIDFRQLLLLVRQVIVEPWLSPFQVLIFIETVKKTAVLNTFGKGPAAK